MDDFRSLERFRTAQASPQGGFTTALDEIRAGRKRSHWIWYIFPQLAGLGSSQMAQAFAIENEQGAIRYLQDSELRDRLLAMTKAVAEQLRTGRPLDALMGSEIDARKLVSSLTLFGAVAGKMRESLENETLRELSDTAAEVLTAATTQGYPRCDFTLRSLRRDRER